MSKQHTIDRLIAGYLTEDLSQEEKEELAAWKEESESNQQKFQQITEKWQNGALRKNWESIDLEGDWHQILQKAGSPSIPTRPLLPILRYAAAAILLIASLLWILNQRADEMIHNSSLSVLVHELPDQSKIWLKPHTSIKIGTDFIKERKVELQGEGFFEVKKSTVPFIVTTNNSSIEVLGTSFNAISKEAYSEVILVEGSVRFASDGEATLLKPGELVRNDNNNIQKKSEDVNMNAIGWKTGVFKFIDTPLHQVMELIKPYYGLEIEIAAQKRNLLLTSSFDQLSLDELLEELTFILNIEIEQKAQTLTIK